MHACECIHTCQTFMPYIQMKTVTTMFHTHTHFSFLKLKFYKDIKCRCKHGMPCRIIKTRNKEFSKILHLQIRWVPKKELNVASTNKMNAEEIN